MVNPQMACGESKKRDVLRAFQEMIEFAIKVKNDYDKEGKIKQKSEEIIKKLRS